MVRKSNYRRVDLAAMIADGAQAYQDATDEVDEAVAAVLGVNRTDLRCLSVLFRGPMKASELADAAGLTRGAITTLLDRMEARGYVRRVRDREDRRAVRVEMTDAARERAAELDGPIAQGGARLLQKYPTRELAGVVKFPEEGTALQRTHAARIRRTTERAGVSSAGAGS
jgi:DNA-binding MarR family transcriptional regulator